MPASLSQISRRGTRPSCCDQLPRPQQQILGLAGRQHPPGDEPRVRRDDHQHRQQRASTRPRAGSASAGTTDRTAPHRPAARPAGPPDRSAMLRPQPADVVPEPRDRPGPADPLRDHRRRHVRMLRQQRPHPRLERRERRRHRPAARTSAARSEATARSTVARPIPRSRATCRRGTPSATSRRINAQSSTEITHPICLGGLVFDRRYGLVFKRRRQV